MDRSGILAVRVTAPPVRGAANDRLIRLLAKATGVGKSRITLISGTRSRDKVVEIEGFTEDELRKKIKT